MAEKNEKNGNELFNRMIRAGKRTYFISVRESKNNRKYLTVTESTVNDAGGFDRSNIMVFPERIGELVQALQEAQKIAG